MKLRALEHLFFGCFTAALLAVSLFAQVERATITGIVRDPSGAVVPAAGVEVRNVNTGAVFTTTTSANGTYVAPNLVPGFYSVTVSATGFKTLTQTNIELHVDERRAVDVTVQVGEVTESIEVTEAPPLLESESSSISNVISRKEVSELPLNGRTIYQLAYLNAGVTNAVPSQNANNTNIPDNGRAAQGLSINGQRQSNNVFILDGVYNNQINQGLIAVIPPLEAVQEFVVETSNFLPEIGRGGGVVNVILKSGTNEFHGQLFDFHRNAALDARNFFDRTIGRRLPNFVQNQFGGVLSGPIVRNRTFFMVDYQGFRQRQGQTFTVTVPSAPLRGGDFNGTARAIYDPATYNAATNTRELFPNATIPASRFNSASTNVMKFYPPTNDPASQRLANGEAFFFSGSSVKRDQDNYDIKIDHRLSDKDSITGRWSWSRSDTLLPGAFSDLPEFAPAVGGALGSGGAGFLNGVVANPASSLGLQWIRTINPTTINEFRAAYIRAGSDATHLGFGTNYADELGIPNTNITENNSGFPAISVSGYGLIGDSPFFPLIEFENIYQVLDNVTFIRGSHTYKAGVDIKKVERNFTQILGFPAGNFGFGTGFTADPGNPAVTGNSFADFLLGIPGSANITTNSGLAGLRSTEFSAYFQDVWKVNTRLTLTYGLRYDLFTPQTEQYDRQVNWDPLEGRLVRPGEGGSYPGLSTRALISTDKVNFAPRFGFAYRLSDKTVVRSSYGLFYTPESEAGFQNTLNPPFIGGVSFTNTSVPQQINRTLDQGLPVSDPFIPIDDPTGGLNARHPDNFLGYTQQWSFNVQRQLGGNYLVELGYVGNNSFHLQDRYDINQPVLGTGPVELRRRYYSVAPRLQAVNVNEQRGKAHYHALQATLNKRFTTGLSLLMNYTWSKTLETPGNNWSLAGHQNVRNLDVDFGPASLDIAHRFVASWLYELPFGRDASGIMKQIAGGWQLGGVALLQTGMPYTVSGGAGRPNRVCKGTLDNPTVQRYFDASCFPIPDPVEDTVRGGVYIPYGNSGNNILYGPGTVNFDLSVFKSFPIAEEKRIEFRSEWFNSFNHPQFFNPQSAVNTGTTGIIVNAKPSRQIQMALKFIF